MGRERIELKKIEKTAARHVTFSKRRKGLIKKAKEISVLCDANVGLIIFSATGRLFEYSNSSMKMILTKYSESFTGNLNIEPNNEVLGRTKQEMEKVERTLRHMDGEDLQELTIEELQKLEQNLEVGLHRIRSTKWNQIEEENVRLHLEVMEVILFSGIGILYSFSLHFYLLIKRKVCLHFEQLKHRLNLENNTAVEPLLIEPVETRDHPQSSESTHTSYTSTNQHKMSIRHDDTSDISLQLGLSI